MVYHLTNFIVETNAWWVRRVRPIWMGATALLIYYIGNRYYFFGKHSAQAQRATPPEVWEERAKNNKRNWGYGIVYKPTLERSRKKQILQAMGSQYDYPIEYSKRMMAQQRTLDEVLEEENNW